MLDFASRVITTFKADVSDMKQGLKELQGEEKKLAQTQLAAANERNKGYDEWVARLGNVNQALELAGKAVAFGKEAFKAYSDDLRLRSAAGAVDIGKLSQASLGLRTEHELLAFAAKASNGVIKASQQDMEVAEKAMIALTRAGFDQTEVTNKITKAMTTAKTEGLEELGLSLKAGKTPLESYTNLMAALGQKASGVKEGTLTAAEGVDQMGATMTNSIDKMKIALGELVASLAPLLNMLARGVGLIADVVASASGGVDVKGAFADPKGYIDRINKLKDSPGGFAALMAASRGDYDGAQKILDDQKAIMGSGGAAGSGDVFGASLPAGGLDQGTLATWLEKNGAKKGKPVDPMQYGMWGGMGAAYGAGDSVDAVVERLTAAITGGGNGLIGAYSKGSATANTEGGAQLSDFAISLGAVNQKMQEGGWLDRHAKQQSFLASTFGELSEFNAYSEAFGMLTGAVTAGMDAWIDGADSMGDAIKRTVADALKALAGQMAIEALKHGAYAIGSLAFGDFAGASAHGVAAAEFGAVAIAAGVGAKAIGTSAGVANDQRRAAEAEKAKKEAEKEEERASKSGSRGGNGGSLTNPIRRGNDGSSQGEGGKDTVVVVYSSAFADGSAAQRRQQATRIVQSVTGQGTGYTEG
jgi:hypothetical protein